MAKRSSLKQPLRSLRTVQHLVLHVRTCRTILTVLNYCYKFLTDLPLILSPFSILLFEMILLLTNLNTSMSLYCLQDKNSNSLGWHVQSLCSSLPPWPGTLLSSPHPSLLEGVFFDTNHFHLWILHYFIDI